MPTSSIDNKKIKHMMPRKNSRYHQGVIDPKSAKKYFESGKKAEFFDVLSQLKKSTVTIDKQTLEMIRIMHE